MNGLLLVFIFILLLIQIESWGEQEECHLSLFKVQERGRKGAVIHKPDFQNDK